MSQALQALAPVARPLPAAGNGAQAAQNEDSGASFGAALADQMKPGEGAPGAAAPAAAAPSPAVSPAGKAPAEPAVVAAAGNTLPPALPPEAALEAGAPSLDANVPAIAGDKATTSKPEDPVASDAPTPVAADPAMLASPPQAVAAIVTTAPQPATDPVATDKTAPAVAGTEARDTPVTTPAVRASAAPQLPAGSDAQADAATPPPANADTKQIAELAAAKPVLTEAAPHTRVESPLPTTTPPAAFTLAANAPPAPAAAPAPGTQVSVPLGHPAWGQQFGNSVVWAVNQGLPAAELHLSPPELGPVSVHIRMEQDQASIAFSSPHAPVRDAIEAALPRLRDMLGSQGIVLADASVAHQHSSQAWREGRAGFGVGSGAGGREDEAAIALAPRAVANGLVDLYA